MVGLISYHIWKVSSLKLLKGGELLNTKYEYNHGILPSINTTDPKSMLPPEAPKKPSRVSEMEMLIFAEAKRKVLEH